MKRSSSGRRPRGLISGIAVVGFAIAALMLAIPSAGATNIVQTQSPAYLRARGAAVETTVMVTCSLRARTVGAYSTPAHASLTIALAERVGKRVAGGTVKVTTRSHDFRCDGNSHLVNVTVPAKSGGPAFAKGGAYAQASLRVCAPTCRVITDARTVRLR